MPGSRGYDSLAFGAATEPTPCGHKGWLKVTPDGLQAQYRRSVRSADLSFHTRLSEHRKIHWFKPGFKIWRKVF